MFVLKVSMKDLGFFHNSQRNDWGNSMRQLTAGKREGMAEKTPLTDIYSWRASPLPLSCSCLTHRIYKVSVSGVAIEQWGLTNLPLSLALRTHKGPGSGVTGRVRVATVFLMPLFSLSLFLHPSSTLLQVFWAHCLNGLFHSVILFWFPLKAFQHGKHTYTRSLTLRLV